MILYIMHFSIVCYLQDGLVYNPGGYMQDGPAYNPSGYTQNCSAYNVSVNKIGVNQAFECQMSHLLCQCSDCFKCC